MSATSEDLQVVRNTISSIVSTMYKDSESVCCSFECKVPLGSQGPAGAGGGAGTPGRQGVAGRPGSLGAKGTAGDQGPQGHRGEKGDRGPTGDRGPRGPSGQKGEKGADGVDPGRMALWGTLGSWACLVVEETRGQRGSQVLWGRKEMKDLMDYLDKRERWEHLGSQGFLECLEPTEPRGSLDQSEDLEIRVTKETKGTLDRLERQAQRFGTQLVLESIHHPDQDEHCPHNLTQEDTYLTRSLNIRVPQLMAHGPNLARGWQGSLVV
ncbi:otolin-1-like [Oncorhynchus keta]|uniref:otolin-1-like n=1 Tax=Oncorhynchus keta TaxID=8018 RepID=UPI00227BC5F1|nr:otolin-1-like [Oncorhynchus keta]